MKRVFTAGEVAISHSEYVTLRKGGKISLGIDNEIATKAVAAGTGPANGGSNAAFHFYSWLAIGVFIVSIYFSFTSAWWWFVPGLIGMSVIWSANKSGNADNLLDAAMYDKEFYERFRAAGVWQYEMSEEDAQKYAGKLIKS